MTNKVVLLTDTHFGIHKNSEVYLKSQLDYFYNEFIPYLESHNIENIFFLGDLFDNRTSINVKVTNEVIELLNKLKDYKIKMLLGNHDVYYNTTIDVNSLKFLDKFENIEVINETKEIEFNNRKMIFIPWQTDINKFIENIKLIEADICFGHFDILTFFMSKYKTSDIGIPSSIFSKFKMTFSGHFHTRSSKQIDKNSEIIYVGSPYQLTRNDEGENRGFCILDLDTLKYEFINNKNSIKYLTLKYPDTYNEKDIKGNVIDVEVIYDKDYEEEKFRNYINEIENLSPIGNVSIKLINNFLGESGENILDKCKDMTIEGLINDYIRSLEINDKEEIHKLVLELLERVK